MAPRVAGTVAGLFVALTVCACGPQQSPAKATAVPAPAAPEGQEVAVDSVSPLRGAGMPTWLEGKLDPSHVAWADNGRDDISDAPQVAITPEHILIDGAIVESTLEAERTWDKPREPLFRYLVVQKEAWRRAHPCEALPGRVVFWIDDRTSAGLVANVLRTVTYAGFINIVVVVRDRAGAGFKALGIDNRTLLIATVKLSDLMREIYATLDRNKLRLEKCAESAGTGDLIHARFVIDTNGRASDVRVDCVKPTVTGLRECVANVLSELRFPAPPNGPLKMQHSIYTGPK